MTVGKVAVRPAHLTLTNIALVAAGGAIGTGLRYGLVLIMPPARGIPVAIFIANVVGAFVLAVLLEALSELSADHGLSRRLRLGVGTGVLGGFTTYSTLAVDSVDLTLSQPALALVYGLGTVIVGGLAAILGIAAARRVVRPALARRRPPS